MSKIADSKYEILDIIKSRWSPRAFSEQPVAEEKLVTLFEAARWSASCFNEQPWRFLIGIKGLDESWQKIFETLSESNKIWCINVPILNLIIGKKVFSHNGKPNGWHMYDAGQAAAYISMQAMAEGLYVHQMAGFDKEKARISFNLPEEFEPVTAMAIGHIGPAEMLPDDLKIKENQPRQRRPLKEILFRERFGTHADLPGMT